MKISFPPKRTLRICTAVATFAVAFMALSATSASALTIGLVWNGDYVAAQQEMEQVQHSGATVFRLPIDISRCNGGGWSECDGIFQAAWEHGITIQPYLVRSNGEGTRFLLSTDKGWGTWGTWSREVVERYGINGNFWNGKANPKPVLEWEVWNEPNLAKNDPFLSGGVEKVQPENYGRFLKYTAEKIQAGSTAKTAHGTEVLFGGLYMPAGEYYNSFLQGASGVSGVPGSYQGVAIHPYSFENGVTQMAERINDVRYGLDHNVAGGAGKPLWITELGWPEGGEGAKHVTEAEQASLLTQSLNWIKGAPATDHISLVDWYNVRDLAGQTKWSYFCGLRKLSGEYRSSWWAFEEETGAPKWPVEPPPAPIPGEDDDFGGAHVVGEANANLDTFYRTASGGLGHDWTTAGGAWNQETLPGSLASGAVPHPIVQSNGVIDVFYRTPSGGLGHNYYLPGSGWFQEPLAGIVASDPHPILLSNGKLEVFYRTASGGLGHDWHFQGGSWGSDVLPGSVAGDPYAVGQSSEVIDVFYRTPSGGLGHDYYLPGSGWFQEPLGGSVASDPHPIVLPNGKIEVFYRTASGGLGHDWHFQGGSWGSDVLTGSVAGEPHVIGEANEVDDIFYRTPSGGLGHSYYLPGSGWSSETLSGSVSGDPYTVIDPNGTISVYYRTTSGGLGHDWHAQGGLWGQEVLAGSLDMSSTMGVHAVAQANGVSDVFYRTPSGGLGHDYYLPGSGWFQDTLGGVL